MKIYFFFLIGIIVILPIHSIAQNNLENNIRLILTDNEKGEEYLKGYTQPLSTAFGVTMGGSLFHRAYTKKFPGFDAGLSLVYIELPDKALTFKWNTENVPTVFGSVDSPENAIQGTDLGKFSLPQVQINLGLTGDFELMIRGWPSYTISEIGEITVYGLGIKYGLSELVSSPSFALDLSVQAAYHALRVGDWLNTGTFGMNIQVSKELTVVPLGLYTGVGYEATSMTITTEEISGIGENAIGDVRLNGENGLRVNFGLYVNLWVIIVHMDYNINYYNSLSAGIKLDF